MGGFQPGDLVDVTIKGVRLGYMHDRGPVVITKDGTELALPPSEIAAHVPDFQHNTLWVDPDGLLWLAQRISDDYPVCLISVLGTCSIADAMKEYGPFLPVREVSEP